MPPLKVSANIYHVLHSSTGTFGVKYCAHPVLSLVRGRYCSIQDSPLRRLYTPSQRKSDYLKYLWKFRLVQISTALSISSTLRPCNWISMIPIFISRHDIRKSVSILLQLTSHGFSHRKSALFLVVIQQTVHKSYMSPPQC